MSKKPLSISELRSMIKEGEIKDPLVFLESVMSGQDPRQFSDIYELILDLNDLGDGDIGPSEWGEVVDHVSRCYKYRPVSLVESSSAAKTLAEYLHSKRKQTDTTGGGSGSYDPGEYPLTEDEIELFKEKFNEEF